MALRFSVGSQPQVSSPALSTDGFPEALARIEWNDFYHCITWPIPKWKWCHNIKSFKLLSSHSLLNLFHIASFVLYSQPSQATVTVKFYEASNAIIWAQQFSDFRKEMTWHSRQTGHTVSDVMRHWGLQSVIGHQMTGGREQDLSTDAAVQASANGTSSGNPANNWKITSNGNSSGKKTLGWFRKGKSNSWLEGPLYCRVWLHH